MRFSAALAIVVCALCAAPAHAGEAPRIFVTITKPVAPAERAQHVEATRRVLHEAFAANGIDASQVDAAVTLGETASADGTTVSAEVKLVISTGDRQIRSFITGTARLALGRRPVAGARLVELRGQLLDDALETLRRRVRSLAPRRTS